MSRLWRRGRGRRLWYEVHEGEAEGRGLDYMRGWRVLGHKVGSSAFCKVLFNVRGLCMVFPFSTHG